MNFRRNLCWLLAAMIVSPVLKAQSNDLLTRVWTGEQQAQAKFTTACGTLTEIRTSRLIVKPLTLHGKFCAEGTDHFMLEYFEPNPMSIRLNKDNLKLQGSDGKSHVMNIGSDVRRIESSFSGKNSIEELQKNFTVTVQENLHDYELRLIPRTDTLRHRFNYLVVTLDKRDFLPRSLEVDGRSGVNSVFTFDITSIGKNLPEDTFEGGQEEVMERNEIERMIPHRAPFLLIEKVEVLVPGAHCIAVMSIDPKDPIFTGHFPGRPILPGVLMIEAVGQTAAVMMAASNSKETIGDALLAAVNRFKFLKSVTPEQEVRIETKKLTDTGSMAYIEGTVFADGVIVATGELSVLCA